MSRLTCYVYVTDESGRVHGFGPESSVPEWARRKITNPNVWAAEPKQVDAEPIAPASKERTVGAKSSDGPPPQRGTGATRARWAGYATAHGVDVRDDWKREDIISACQEAGIEV